MTAVKINDRCKRFVNIFQSSLKYILLELN